MGETAIFWFRRDLRLDDHPGLRAATTNGREVIPVFILDPETEAIGAAPRWRLEQSIAAFQRDLLAIGSRLILRRGPALAVLQDLINATGAREVHWSRNYAPEMIARDSDVKAALKTQGIGAHSHDGHLLCEPWSLAPKDKPYYRVYSPFWRALRVSEIPQPCAPVERLKTPPNWPPGDDLADWQLGRGMHRGARIVARYACIGEARAQDRLANFLDQPWSRYGEARDQLAMASTSFLSENLTYGEISPRRIWWCVRNLGGDLEPGGETFLKELVWRDFAYHLIYHTPHIASENWKPEWNRFPWRDDWQAAEPWRRGQTGIPVIDAAMRQLYVTGMMHNRARMLVASYLTKHMMIHWKIGMNWFAECLTDWDPASNAMGWQWTAGSGPDASPFFRIFNPETQAEKFDASGAYRRRYLAEYGTSADEPALDFFEACPRSWNMHPEQAYPEHPIVDLKAGRERALAAYKAMG